MRHLWSFLAGLVVAPVTWVLVTLGQDGSARTVDRWVEIGTYSTANLIEPAVYLGVAGILLGLLGTLRFSPLGPLVAGLLLITPYVGMFVAPFTVRDQIPDGWKVLGDPLPLRLPVENGTLFLIGVLLLMATFSAQRWRRWPATGGEPEPAPADNADRERRPLTDWPPSGADGRAGHRPAEPRLPRTDPHRAAAPPEHRPSRRGPRRRAHRPTGGHHRDPMTARAGRCTPGPRRPAGTVAARSALEQLAGHDDALDLVGALVDLGDLGVAHHPLDRVVRV